MRLNVYSTGKAKDDVDASATAWCSPTGASLMLRRRFALSVIAIGVCTVGFMRAGAGAAQAVLALDGDVSPVHDPVVIKERGTYYGVLQRRSAGCVHSTMLMRQPRNRPLTKMPCSTLKFSSAG